MTDTLVLFLPTGTVPWRWLRIADGVVSARGEGLPEPGDDGSGPPIASQIASPITPPIAIAPADAVTLHWAELPDRSTAQAVTAARLLASDASAAPIGDLHVAVGREDGHAERPIAVVSTAQMRSWLAMLADHGIDPAMLVPSPLLLPRPEQGYIRADLGGEGVVRGPTSGFADDAGLTDLITGGVAPATLGLEDMEAAIVAAIASPPLDLRQGVFARRRRKGIDWALIRRLAWLVVAILSVTLLISVVQIAKYSMAADALEREADLLARQGLPRGETVNNADRQLDARLLGLRGGGVGFSRTVAAVYAAVRAVPGSEVYALTFQANGDLHVAVGTQNEGQANDLKARIEAYGFAVSQAGAFQAGPGGIKGEFLVTPR